MKFKAPKFKTGNFWKIVHKFSSEIVREVSLITIMISLGIVTWANGHLDRQSLQTEVKAKLGELQEQIEQLRTTKDQIGIEKDRFQEAYEKVATDSAVQENQQWKEAVDLYLGMAEKYEDYQNKGVDLSEYEDSITEMLTLLLTEDYENLKNKVTETDGKFEELLAAKIEEDKKKAATTAAAAAQTASTAPANNNPGTGYSRVSVSTEKGNFTTDIVKVSLNSIQVVTVTGNDGNCENNCVTKPLATYISENSGFAGINGTYFCPPDYSSCAGKVNSYDFPVYSTQHNKWINADKLFWDGRAMMAFVGSTPRYCGSANSCDSGGTSAGIVNYPNLINGGQIGDFGGIPDALKNVRGYRGAIGVQDNWLYLMVVRGATVPDVAYVMKSLGIQQGMNLDGGGSTALYYHGYKAGPGRSLPNAVVLKYK